VAAVEWEAQDTAGEDRGRVLGLVAEEPAEAEGRAAVVVRERAAAEDLVVPVAALQARRLCGNPEEDQVVPAARAERDLVVDPDRAEGREQAPEQAQALVVAGLAEQVGAQEQAEALPLMVAKPPVNG